MNFNQIVKTMGWPFVIVYLALIVSAIYLTFVEAPNALNSNQWPEVKGQVTEHKIIERKRTKKTGEQITVYSAKIDYQYIVNGQEYQSNQIRLADRHKKNITQMLNTTYAIGSPVTVYYNPQNPSNAVLQKGLTTGHILTGLFLLMSIGAMAFALYQNASNRK